jgi:hypothetical protein
LDDAENFKISPEYIAGEAPDIGAYEFGLDKNKSQKITSLQVDAGENQAVEQCQLVKKKPAKHLNISRLFSIFKYAKF